MRFNPKARLDPSQVQDRGRSGGGGLPGGFGGGGGGVRVPTSGGVMGVIVTIIVVVVFGTGALGGGSPSTSATSENDTSSAGGSTSECQTGQDANESQKCQLVAITNSVQSYWAKHYPEQTGREYQSIQTITFTGGVQTQGCGSASSSVGPFYCPNDQRVYLDLAFFKDLLEGQLGGKDSAFTEAYVVAHEYGHHIENQLGVLAKVRTQQGAGSDAVKLELMADCLAGAWAKGAQSTEGADGQPLISELTQADIKDGLDAAATVGDDQIQSRTSGRVNADSWTHGSAKQRQAAFNIGLREGTIKSCNFFERAKAPRP